MMILAKFSTMENVIYLYNYIILLHLNLPHKLLTIPNFKCYTTVYYEKSIRAKLAVSLQFFSLSFTPN